MSGIKILKRKTRLCACSTFLCVLIMALGVSQQAIAEGVFNKKSKAKHSLFGTELNKIKQEHHKKFGQARKGTASIKSDNPWERKKQKSNRSIGKAQWGACRDYALQKRNRCYREGQNAYRCEQRYEARARLCDNDF